MMGEIINLCLGEWGFFKVKGTKEVGGQLVLSDDEEKSILVEPKEANQFEKVKERFEKKIEDGEDVTLMGVCRGKISEGMDFSDMAARLVLVIGIPYCSISDPKVGSKKEFLTKKSSLLREIDPDQTDSLSGRNWYEQQAQRAINQAIGRVIRHKNDYGAIVLIDSRYKNAKPHRSKWMQSDQKDYENLDDLLHDMTTFLTKMDKLDPKSVKYDPEEAKARNDSKEDLKKKIKRLGDKLVYFQRRFEVPKKRKKVEIGDIEEEFRKIDLSCKEDGEE